MPNISLSELKNPLGDTGITTVLEAHTKPVEAVDDAVSFCPSPPTGKRVLVVE